MPLHEYTHQEQAMAKKKKATHVANDISPEQARQEFGISLDGLKSLMQTRGHDGMIQLNETFGGLSGLGEKLKTNLINGKIFIAKFKKITKFFAC